MDLLPESTDTLQLLRRGRIEVEGRLVSASNATFYCSVSLDGVTVAGVYKPVRGERPLWDFAHGSLARREVAAYLFSAESGWNLVPPTVLRDGPFGEGMCQLWIEHDPDHGMVDIVPRGAVPDGWRTVLEAYDGDGDEVLLIHADHDQLRRIAIFDTIVNNADRKGGHVLVGEDDEVLGIDHGLCFHEDDKLRTVLWGWAGESVPAPDLDVLERLRCGLDGQLGRALSELLEVDEIAAMRARLARLHRQGRLPQPGEGWPSIPWPVF